MDLWVWRVEGRPGCAMPGSTTVSSKAHGRLRRKLVRDGPASVSDRNALRVCERLGKLNGSD